MYLACRRPPRRQLLSFATPSQVGMVFALELTRLNGKIETYLARIPLSAF